VPRRRRIERSAEGGEVEPESEERVLEPIQSEEQSGSVEEDVEMVRRSLKLG
jgi:hypothetical protein